MRWQRYPSRSFHSAEQREAAQQSQAGARRNHTPVIPPSSQHGRHPGSSASAGVAVAGVTAVDVTAVGVTAVGRSDRVTDRAPSMINGSRPMRAHRGSAPEPAAPLSCPAVSAPAAPDGDAVVGAGSDVGLVGVVVLDCSAPDEVSAVLDGAGSVVVAVLTTSEVTIWVMVVGSAAGGVLVSVVSCCDVPPLPPSTERPPESPPASGDPLIASIRVTAPREDAKTATAAVTARTSPVPSRRRVGRGRPGSARSGPGRDSSARNGRSC